jgi:hypothetical protein
VTCADVIKYLGRVLPRWGMDPAAAIGLLEGPGGSRCGVRVRASGMPGGVGAGNGAG